MHGFKISKTAVLIVFINFSFIFNFNVPKIILFYVLFSSQGRRHDALFWHTKSQSKQNKFQFIYLGNKAFVNIFGTKKNGSFDIKNMILSSWLNIEI